VFKAVAPPVLAGLQALFKASTLSSTSLN